MVHEVDQVEGEDTYNLSIKVLQEHVNQKLNLNTLIHRLDNRLENPKKYTKAKPLLIIVKYVRYNTRNIIYRNKKVLEGKGITVTKSLTKKAIKML